MDVALDRSLGFVGKEILFRKIEFERYRKPHVVEYPRSAIVLNPQHTRQLRDAMTTQRQSGEHDDSDADDGDRTEAVCGRSGSDGDDDDDDDDPRRIDKATQLCSDAQFRNSLQPRWQHIAPVGLGLMNLGNTCFANSVLQAFAHTPALAQYFMNTFRSADSQLGSPFDFSFALAETFRGMRRAQQGGGGGAYRPAQIMSNLRLLSKHFSIGRQSDAHEFAVQLLFACQKSLLHRLVGSRKIQPRVAHTTALYRICGGYLLSQVTWSRQEEIQQLLRAGKQQEAMDLKMEAKQAAGKQARRASQHGLDAHTLCSNTYDPFTILSVELVGNTLYHCFDKFCALEELDGRSYLSPRDVGVRAKKKFSIHIPPPVVIVHLKRFGPTGKKINKHVQFPLELDITRYCTPLPSSSPPLDHTCSLNGANSASAKRADCQYELNAVCIHEGHSIDYGHYYTVAKSSNGMWYEFNDSHVSRLSEDRLQRTQVYMLFYSRKPTPAAGKSSSHQKPNTNGTVRGVATPSALEIGLGTPGKEDGCLGREVSESELQKLLEKRRAEERQTNDLGRGPSSSSNGLQSQHRADAAANGTATSNGAKTALPSSGKSIRVQAFKRVREDLLKNSDSDDEHENRDGAYARRMRTQFNGRGEQSSDGEANTVSPSLQEGEMDDDALADGKSRPNPTKGSPYGGLIKSMKRVLKSNTEDGAPDDATAVQQRRQTPNSRIGRHAVQVLHTRKALNTPETVRRPASATKFQQRIRDPMWEMEMDRGKLKKVKSKEKAPDPFEGVNPFQEVSEGKFDIRGRPRRD